MPRTLWWYILVELWRLLLLCTGVLVMVIAFAATIKPLADGKLDAAQAVYFMLLAIPPMLAFALPFAAGFGTTLAYHRLGDDNEQTAVHAGGISHRSFLFPALLTGLILAGGIALLNDQIIPRYLSKMEQLITQDITKMLIRSLSSGQTARFQDIEIYADKVDVVDPGPDSDFSQVAKLTHVAALEFDSDGGVSAEITAATAWLLIFPAASLPAEDRAGFDDGDMVVQIKFQDLVAVLDGKPVNLDVATTPAKPVPSAFNDDPKFLTGSELRDLRQHPEKMNWVRGRGLVLARQLAAVQSVRAMHRRIGQDQSIIFDSGERHSFHVRAAGVVWDEAGWWVIEPLDGSGRVEIDEYMPDGSVSQMSAQTAQLTAERADAGDPFSGGRQSTGLSFKLELENVRVSSAAGDARITATTELPKASFPGLTVPGDPMERLATLSSAELLTEVEPFTRKSNPLFNPALTKTADSLRGMIAKLGREITSKQHERYAMALNCLVMVLTGAVTAIRLRNRLPLVVYLWSFFPALLTVILISSGQSTTHKLGPEAGLPVLYGGVAVLAIYTLITYWSIRRH